MTRSTAKAGQLAAGDTINTDNLLGVLDFASVTEGVKVGDVLRERLAAAETAVAAHAAGEASAILAGDEVQQHHEAEAARLQRQVERLRLAIETADDRMAVVAEQERRAEGEAAARRAEAKAGEVETLAGEYVKAAQRVAELLNALDVESAVLIRDRSAAQAAGVECSAQLPHEARFVPERTESREIIDRQRGAAVYDASGAPLDGKPVAIHETKRTETVVVQRRHAPPAVTAVRALLPGPDGEPLVDRNRD